MRSDEECNDAVAEDNVAIIMTMRRRKK